jgi:hypothetical protein
VVEAAAASGAARGLVDGHDGGRGDEGGDERHEHQDRERLLVQNLHNFDPMQKSRQFAFLIVSAIVTRASSDF